MALPEIAITIILVNDGSSMDLTGGVNQLKSSLPIVVFSNDKNMGKGYSIRKAAINSQADHLIFTDVDFPYTTDSFVSLFKTLDRDSCDVAIGVRDENYYDKLPESRRRISKLLKNINQKLMHLETADTQCGLKGMTTKGKDILLQTKQNRYLIDLEFIKQISKREDLNTQLVTVKLREGVTFSKVPASKILSEGLSYFKVLFDQ